MNLLMCLKIKDSLFFESYSIVVGIWIAVVEHPRKNFIGDIITERIALPTE